MGMYLNPGNGGFAEITRKDYIDKTGMISLINESINTTSKLMCISRPRRFGKSFAAQMVCAYYDHTVDSSKLFEGYEISKDDSYEEYRNAFNVIYLDIATFISDMKQAGIPIDDITKELSTAIRKDISKEYPELSKIDILTDCILNYVEFTNRKIVFIIDEWDAVIRESTGSELIQKNYLNLLRSLFKNGNFTEKAVAAAYMTGILPIKKDGSESAVSDFNEYSVLEPLEFAKYTGFTEDEVQRLCSECGMDFNQMKEWYDGYTIGDVNSIYNPYSVMKSVNSKKFKSYWRKTTTTESLVTYVNLNYDALQDKIAALIAGESVSVYTDDFENDFQSFKTDDDVLTLLIHLGYLSYDEATSTAKVPNKEVSQEFVRLLRTSKNEKLMELAKNSRRMLAETLNGNCENVAAILKKVRHSNYGPTLYNNEQALRYAIKIAYIACGDDYIKIEELPSGHGLADIAYIPKPASLLPALLVELKWNMTEESAIRQIKDKDYPAVFDGYGGEVLLVGVNYDDKTDEHICTIEKIRM